MYYDEETNTIDDYPAQTWMALKLLANTFDILLPGASMHFGHIVIDDFNWNSAEWAIEHIDDHFQDVANEHGIEQATLWRDASLHLLHIIKAVVDQIPDNVKI